MALPVSAYQHGIYPRSESVVEATRDLERGRTAPDHVEEAFRRDREEYLELQRRAGLDLLSDGLLRWQDLFRALVDSSEGLEAQVLVRWFDNNSFFRAPAVRGKPTLRDPAPWLEENGFPEPRVATLPSPYLFSRAAQSDQDPDVLMMDLARDVLAPAAGRLVAAGAALVHLEEPWLPYFGIGDSSWEGLEQALGPIREATEDAVLVLHLYYGDAAPYADRLRRLPVDAVGIDFTVTDPGDLPAPLETGLVAGVLDGRRSVVEDPEKATAFVRTVVERLQPSSLHLSSGSDLELLGEQAARRKVEVLGETAARLREELS
jgi:5-methyltetrahydropteroyltriglutamate--homocysteine methyltransferase